jgi:hypothetical protein
MNIMFFRLGDNIKIDLRGMEWRDMDWIALAQDRDRWQAFLNAAKNILAS